MSHRISLAIQITGNFKHLKRTIKELLKRRGVGHILQTTQVYDSLNDNQKQTCLFMEGYSTVLYHAQEELVSHLHSTFPGIYIQDWQEMASDVPLLGSHIAPTPGSLSKDSSGYKEELEEHQIQKPEERKWKDYFGSGFIQIVTAIQNGRQVAYEIHSSIESIKEKFVYISYKSNTVHLNIGACILWSLLKKVIQDCEGLQLKKPIQRMYAMVEGKKCYETDWFGLKPDGVYYVETEDEISAQKFTTMEEFYETLKNNQDLDDDEVQIIKDRFKEQKIKFKQLMQTGDLAITDEKLKDDGITQRGLRTAILAVIKSQRL